MCHHRLLCHFQGKADVSVEVGHKNQSSTDTCSQLFFSLLARATHIGRNAFRKILQELATIRRYHPNRVVEEVEGILLHAVLD